MKKRWVKDLNINGIIIDAKLIDVCKELKDEISDGHTFAVMTKVEITRDCKIAVKSDYHVPKQEIDGDSIYFDSSHMEQLKSMGFNYLLYIRGDIKKSK